MLTRPHAESIDSIVVAALMEDAPSGDITTQSIIPRTARISAELVAREAGVLCGEDVFRAAMTIADASIVTTFDIHDGTPFEAGTRLATILGPAQGVLRAERVALNLTQHLCGIATLTAKYVAEVAGTRARVVDTRKTTPGLRVIERYAVRCGGGHNHRFSLSDAVLVKDNHLAVLAGSIPGRVPKDITQSLTDMRNTLSHTTHVEVEVDRIDQIEPVLAAGVDTIMLDNFSPADMREAVKMIAGRAKIEASGNIKLSTVREVAETGVDLISVGALTQNAHTLDLGLDTQFV
jgi:nicotinate-nucleotide pyrophosphorylase (carboxylating)